MRTLTDHRGVTLPELLLVLLLSVAFAAALQGVVRLAATQATAAVNRAGANRDQVAVWALASRELRHVERADIQLPASNALEFDRPIGEGPVCALQPSAVLLRSDHGGFTRAPDAGRDRLLLREPGAAGAWLSRGIVSVAVANCPDLRPALRIATDGPIAAVGFARIVEPVRLRSYPSGTGHALGLESRVGAGTIQPLAGPINSADFGVTMAGHTLRLQLSRAPLLPLAMVLPVGPPP
jgi:hypothetical protein